MSKRRRASASLADGAGVKLKRRHEEQSYERNGMHNGFRMMDEHIDDAPALGTACTRTGPSRAKTSHTI